MAKSRVKKTSRTSKPRQLVVGDRVQFKLAGRTVSGTIVEDRGNLGVGGRQIVSIRAKRGREADMVVEIPAEEVKRIERAA
jgi:hypothetical protein